MLTNKPCAQRALLHNWRARTLSPNLMSDVNTPRTAMRLHSCTLRSDANAAPPAPAAAAARSMHSSSQRHEGSPGSAMVSVPDLRCACKGCMAAPSASWARTTVPARCLQYMGAGARARMHRSCAQPSAPTHLGRGGEVLEHVAHGHARGVAVDCCQVQVQVEQRRRVQLHLGERAGGRAGGRVQACLSGALSDAGGCMRARTARRNSGGRLAGARPTWM